MSHDLRNKKADKPWPSPTASRRPTTTTRTAVTRVWGFFKPPFVGGGSNNNNNGRTTPSASSSSSSAPHHHHGQSNALHEGLSNHAHVSNSVSFIASSLLPTRGRLKLDPGAKLYFPEARRIFEPYEPGKQARSSTSILKTPASPT